MSISEHELRQLLQRTHTIAVVGLAANPLRPSNSVAAYMQVQGYRIVPVNPAESVVLGEEAYPDLSAIPFPIDLALIFRHPEAVGPHVDEAIALNIPAIWMQPGARNETAAEKARTAGLTVVMDRCIRTDHRRMR